MRDDPPFEAACSNLVNGFGNTLSGHKQEHDGGIGERKVTSVSLDDRDLARKFRSSSEATFKEVDKARILLDSCRRTSTPLRRCHHDAAFTTAEIDQVVRCLDLGKVQ